MSYAGDLNPKQAWDFMIQNPTTQLIDVRTTAEWAAVGVPDTAPLNRQPILLSWQIYPTMQIDEDFITKLSAQIPDSATPLLFLCRSGARSRAAATAATQAGYRQCYNVVHGFEGGPGPDDAQSGWKHSGLPWIGN